MDRREVYKRRRKNEYELMKNMKGPIIDFTVNDINDPTVYTITFNIKTCIGEDAMGRPVYRNKSTVDVTLPPDYPDSAPRAVMREQQPAHVNWYKSRSWCYGHWSVDEPLWSYVRRMAKTIQFAPEYTNANSRANSDCLDLWKEGLRNKWFPCDRQTLPTGDKKKSHIRMPTGDKRNSHIRIH